MEPEGKYSQINRLLPVDSPGAINPNTHRVLTRAGSFIPQRFGGIL